MTGPKFTAAALSGRRGAGFGNEAVAWAKGFIAARELGAKHLAPMWGFHRQRLHRQLGLGLASLSASHALAATLPTVRISEAMYRSTREVDFGAAVRHLAQRGDFDSAQVVITEGMWGGYAAIASARCFLLRQLLAAPGVAKMLSALAMESGATPTIGVHVRHGDFASTAPSRGEFNRAVPLSWYVEAVEALHEALDGHCRVVVCSDAPSGVLEPLTKSAAVTLVRGKGPASAIQELAVLSSADLLICSVSSFSMLAAFISDSPYLWYAPQLTPVGNFWTLWGDEPAQQASGSATLVSTASCSPGDLCRGTPWAPGASLDSRILDLVKHRAELRSHSTDLLYYGAVPMRRDG